MIYVFDGDVAKEYGVNEAIMITNLQFWIAKNKACEKHFYDDHWWTYNSKAALTKLFPFWSVQTVKTTLNRLKEKGVIITGNYNKNAYDKTLWYAFADEGKWLKEPTIKKLEPDVRLVEINQPIPDIIPDNNIKNIFINKNIKKLSLFADYEYLFDALEQWLQYKKDRKQSYKSDKTILIFCKKLHTLCGGNPDIAMQIIEQSMGNNWSGIFPLQNNNTTNATKEEINEFASLWCRFADRVNNDRNNPLYSFSFATSIPSTKYEDVEKLYPKAKSVLVAMLNKINGRTDEPVVNINGLDKTKPWVFAINVLYQKWKRSSFLQGNKLNIILDAQFFLRNIEKIADPYDATYLN